MERMPSTPLGMSENLSCCEGERYPSNSMSLWWTMEPTTGSHANAAVLALDDGATALEVLGFVCRAIRGGRRHLGGRCCRSRARSQRGLWRSGHSGRARRRRAVPARRVRAAAVFMVTFAVVLVVRLSAAELARKRGEEGRGHSAG